jgi:hypothetical protein
MSTTDEQTVETPIEDTPDGQMATEPTPETEPDNAPEDDDGDGDDKGDITKARAQAAKYRARLREAEQERDALSEQLEQAEQRVIGYALARVSIDRRLWELSEVDLDTLRDDSGHLDIRKVIDTAQSIRTEVYGPGPRPNPQQGSPSQAPATSGLRDAFDPKRV